MSKFLAFIFFLDRVLLCSCHCTAVLDSLCTPGWLRIYRDLPASASRVLGLKECAATPGPAVFQHCFKLLEHGALF